MKLTLKALRINNNLTQREAAKSIGISRSTLKKYEDYESFPTVKNIQKIQKLYNVHYDDILFLPQKMQLICKNNKIIFK